MTTQSSPDYPTPAQRPLTLHLDEEDQYEYIPNPHPFTSSPEPKGSSQPVFDSDSSPLINDLPSVFDDYLPTEETHDPLNLLKPRSIRNSATKAVPTDLPYPVSFKVF